MSRPTTWNAQVIAWLEDFLITQRQPLVMVTHDRYFLDRVVDRIVEIDRGQAFGYERAAIRSSSHSELPGWNVSSAKNRHART